jgi:hypothetical protein
MINQYVEKEISNNKKCHIRIVELYNHITKSDERLIRVINDWNQVMDFEFETKEQVLEVIEALKKLSERWS